MTPLLGTLRATHPTRTPRRPPHGGLRRELHGGWGAELAKERDPGERRAEAGGGVAHDELLSQSCLPDQPCLTAGSRNGQMGEGGVTTAVSSFSQTLNSLHCKPARPSFTPRVSFRAPEPQPHVGGYPSPILQICASQLSGESSELPGDRVHSGCMTSNIKIGRAHV